MILALSLQVIGVYVLDSFTLVNLKQGLFIVSYIVLGVAVSQNLHLRGLRLIFLGLLLNFAAIVANGGFMPVSPEALNRAGFGEKLAAVQPGTPLPGSKDILLAREDTRLWFISDVVALPPPISKVISPGDILIGIGLLAFFIVPLKQGGKRLHAILLTASKAKSSRPKQM
jgi:hypothetical protein